MSGANWWLLNEVESIGYLLVNYEEQAGFRDEEDNMKSEGARLKFKLGDPGIKY